MADQRISSLSSPGPDLIEPPGRPLKIALAACGVFFAAGVGYILFSSHFAALTAATVPDLASIEKTKGLLFIVFTTVLLFCVLYAMLLRLDRQQRRLLNFGNRLIAAERQASALVLADSVAHEVSNLLMTLEYHVQELADAAGEEKKDALQKVNSSQDRLKALARRLARVSGREARKTYFNLFAAVSDALAFAEKHRSLRFCKIEQTGPEDLMFMGNLLLIYQMILNLVLNAAEAAGEHGRIRVDLLERDDFVYVEVHDNGPGIAPDMRKTVMEAFYTTRKNGSGLGLLSVEACARAHRGEVEIRDSDLGGACFAVWLKKTPAVIDDQ